MLPQDTALIVDPSMVARDLLARFLARDFQRVDAVASVAEAEERCEEEAPSLVVLDAEGKESLPWFLEWTQRPTRPSFLFVTGHPTRAEEAEVSMHGAVGYLAKPISHRQLSCALAALSSTFDRTPRRLLARPLALASLEDPITVQEQISCEVRDLGIEGAFLTATTPIALGTRLRLRLHLGAFSLRVAARVVRVQEPAWGATTGWAVAFEHDEESHAVLERFVRASVLPSDCWR